jgi:hypothetical protein
VFEGGEEAFGRVLDPVSVTGGEQVEPRLAGDWGRAFGTLPPGLDFGAIIARATPKLG